MAQKWTPKPPSTGTSAALPGTTLVLLYFQTVYARSQDPLWLANFQSATPMGLGLSRLPGATDQDKVNYAIDYIAAGMKLGASAADMLAHDTDMVKAHPKVNGVWVTNPATAAQEAFGGGGRLYLIQGNLDREIENDPNWQFATAPQYRNFWKTYGMP